MKIGPLKAGCLLRKQMMRAHEGLRKLIHHARINLYPAISAWRQKNIKWIASTPDVLHVVENEGDILDCNLTCSENPQYLEEAHQRGIEKTTMLAINVYNTLNNKL